MQHLEDMSRKKLAPSRRPAQQEQAQAERVSPKSNPFSSALGLDDLLYGKRPQNNTDTAPSRPSNNTSPSRKGEMNDLMDLLDSPEKWSSRARSGRPPTSREPADLGVLLSEKLAEEERRGMDNPEWEAASWMALKPSRGRTVTIDSTRGDVTQLFRVLESLCARNRVRRDEKRDSVFVRKGMAKKTLRSQRWRNQFMEGFLHECGRVRRMKAQGW